MAAYAEYRKALDLYMRHGQAALDKQDIRAALSVGSEPDGGYTVIPDTDPMPREKLFRTSPMRAVASVLPITSDHFEGLVEKGDFAATWVDEFDERAETEAGTLGSFSIYARELYALVPVTQKLIEDSSIDIDQYVEGRLMRRFTRGENSAFVTGNGVLKPRGFMDYKTTATTQTDENRARGVVQYVATGASGAFPTLSGIAGAAEVAHIHHTAVSPQS